MKKFILAFIALSSSIVANAAEITLLDTPIPYSRAYTTVDTRFHIDTDMKEGYAKVVVEEEEYINNYPNRCWRGGYGPRGPYGPGYPGGYYCDNYPTRTYRTIFSENVKIEGLTTNGNEVIYQGENGDVVCGRMGKSRVFKVPTLFLSGNCTLKGQMYLENGVKKLVVKFKTN